MPDVLAAANYWVGAVFVSVIVVTLLVFLGRGRTAPYVSVFGPAKLSWESGLGAVALIAFAPLAKWLHVAFGITPWEGSLAALAIIVGLAAAFQTIRMKFRGA